MATEPERTPQGTARSPEWHKVEEAHLKVQSWCKNCGVTTKLQVHHMMPFHLNQTKELDPTNLITLCENSVDGVECHLHVGHFGNWKSFNPAIASIANSPAPGISASHILIATSNVQS